MQWSDDVSTSPPNLQNIFEGKFCCHYSGCSPRQELIFLGVNLIEHRRHYIWLNMHRFVLFIRCSIMVQAGLFNGFQMEKTQIICIIYENTLRFHLIASTLCWTEKLDCIWIYVFAIITVSKQRTDTPASQTKLNLFIIFLFHIVSKKTMCFY